MFDCRGCRGKVECELRASSERALPMEQAEPAKPKSAAKAGYLPTLDGWRALAVTLVILCHWTLADESQGFQEYGNFGVEIFFGISGFLICTRLLDEERKHGRISLSGFYIRRSFRILPPALTYLAFLGLLTAIGVLLVTPMEFISSVLFFRNYYRDPANQPGWWYTIHFWSLAVEEHFYFFFPGLLVCCGTRKAVWWVAGLALAIALWRRIDTYFNLVTDPGAVFHTDRRLDSLLWGCFAALIVFRFPQKTSTVFSWGLAFWALAGFVVYSAIANPPLAFFWRSRPDPLDAGEYSPKAWWSCGQRVGMGPAPLDRTSELQSLSLATVVFCS